MVTMVSLSNLFCNSLSPLSLRLWLAQYCSNAANILVFCWEVAAEFAALSGLPSKLRVIFGLVVSIKQGQGGFMSMDLDAQVVGLVFDV